MKFLFFIFGLVALLYERWKMFNYDKIDALRKKISKTVGSKENLKTTNSEALFLFCIFLYLFWAAVGLFFSSQWLLFAALFIVSFLNAKIRGRFWNVIDSVLSMAIISFAIINAFHLHINLWQWLLKQF